MKLQACYTVLLETIADGQAARAHLVGTDGKTIGMYTHASKGAAVENACVSLEARGAHDAAAAIRRNWAAQQGSAS